jgi:hypothetical protein
MEVNMEKYSPSPSPEETEVLNPQNPNNVTSKNPDDREMSVALFAWLLCGFFFVIGAFSRRMYLLEFVVPALAFVGFIFLGIYLIKSSKQKCKRTK